MRVRVVVLLAALAACAAPAPAAPPAPAPLPVPPPPPGPAPVASETVPEAGPAATATPPSAPDAATSGTPCPESEVWVPPTGAGGFVMGKAIKGEHRVVLTHGFCVDASEVTVRDYARCVEAGACKEPGRGDPWSTYPTKLDQPVNMVSWSKAHTFCAWAGRRLPTEAEWEWAATGPGQTRYPWGDEPEPSCDYVDYTRFGAPKWEAGGDLGCGGGGPSPVGSHPKGDKVWPGGAIHDLAGNVWEWVEDSYGPYALDTRAVDPVLRLDVAVHGIRGGGWNRSYAAMVVTYRGAAHYGYQVPALGFRCVRGEPLATPSPVYE
ncbi:MAG TPA: formylglycine-generating enzyme family protein [Polyangiaceae bacterium]|nr:formylglycine-generating enzyme family protein [Polyangiaceae bacterium]